jgi:TonB family protein
MSLTRTNRRGAAMLILWVCCAGIAFGSDDTLAQAKDLYATAAYDEALAVLDRLQTNASAKDSTPIAEYRVFCLLALDRRVEARRTIETILNDNPLYLPSAELASPRIQTVFRETRRQVLPTIVRDRYAAAKAAFERKDPRAGEQFEAVLTLLDDPDVQNVPALSDLKTVVSAFRDLTRAMADAAPPPLAAVRMPSPESQAATIGTPALDPNTVYTVEDRDVVPPVVVTQRIPKWAPSRRELMQDFNGTLRVLVDENGKVSAATLETSVHPIYDAELLKAVRGWKFAPATKRGTPVRYLKTFNIRLTPGMTTGR